MPDEAGEGAKRERVEAALARHRVVTGGSMVPTLRGRELLEVAPYGGGRPRPGDVIFFRRPGSGELVVHRVTRVTPAGIRTRGDAKRADDDWLVQPGGITGKVVAAWRGQKRYSIRGGCAGRLLAGFRHARRRLTDPLRAALRPLFERLVRSGLLAGIVRPRVLALQIDGRPVHRLMLGRRVIGQYDPAGRRWHIDRHFRPFVRDRTLPRP